MHAYGARIWTGDSSRHHTPGFQTPALTRSLLYMDAPWRLQWPCLVPWLIGQAITSVAWLRNAVSSEPPSSLCLAASLPCPAVHPNTAFS